MTLALYKLFYLLTYLCFRVCITSVEIKKLMAENTDKPETPDESPPAYADIAAFPLYPAQPPPPPYTITESHQFQQPQFPLSTNQPSPYPWNTAFFIPPPLPQQPSQHLQQQVVKFNSLTYWYAITDLCTGT